MIRFRNRFKNEIKKIKNQNNFFYYNERINYDLK